MNKNRNEINLYRDILKLYRKALDDTGAVLKLLKDALAGIDDPAMGWVDMAGKIQQHPVDEAPEDPLEEQEPWLNDYVAADQTNDAATPSGEGESQDAD